MTNHDNWLEMADSYSLGALDPTEFVAFQSHLASDCAQCAERVYETQKIMMTFPGSLAPVSPRLEVKAMLLNHIRSSTAPQRLGTKAFSPVSMGVAAILIVSILIGSYMTATPQKSILQKPPMHSASMITLLSDPSVKMIELKGQDGGISAFGKLVWSFKDCGGCLVLKKLIRLHADKVFQLWGMGPDKKPFSIGTFTADAHGNAHVDFDPSVEARAFEQFAVTIEPSGGSLLPTGTIQIFGSL